jgi:hypothetical protein
MIASITWLRPASFERSSALVSGLSSVAASKIRTTSKPAAYRFVSQRAEPRGRVLDREHLPGSLDRAGLAQPLVADQ